jgi:hypothetical protein
MPGGVTAALIIVTSLLPIKSGAAYCFDCFDFSFVLVFLSCVYICLDMSCTFGGWISILVLYIYTEFSLFSQWYKEPCLVYIRNLEKFPNVVGGHLVW